MFDVNTVVNNLYVVAVLTGIFVLVWLSNVCFSLFYNLVKVQETFEWKRCYQGALKALCVLLGLFMITIVISTLPAVLNFAGINIPESVASFVSMATILVPFGSAILYYLKDAIETFKNILGKDVIDFIDEEEIDDIDEGVFLDTAEENIEEMIVKEESDFTERNGMRK